MNNITILVDQAMAQWQEETDTGANDPAFAGEVGEEIDRLVDGLSEIERCQLMKATSTASFQPLKGRTRIINGIWLGEIGIVEGADGKVTYDALTKGTEITFMIKSERFKFENGDQKIEMSKEEAISMANFILDLII